MLQSLAAGADGERWSVFFPGVANKAESWIAQWLFRWRGKQHSLPALVLINVERSLIQTVPDRERRQR